jgi:hypothetical protein
MRQARCRWEAGFPACTDGQWVICYAGADTSIGPNRDPVSAETGEQIPARPHDSGSAANGTVDGLEASGDGVGDFKGLLRRRELDKFFAAQFSAGCTPVCPDLIYDWDRRRNKDFKVPASERPGNQGS